MLSLQCFCQNQPHLVLTGNMASNKTLVLKKRFSNIIQHTHLEGLLHLGNLSDWFSPSYQQEFVSYEAQHLSAYVLCLRNIMIELMRNSKNYSIHPNCRSFPALQ